MQEDKHNYYVALSYKDVETLSREQRKEKINNQRKQKVCLARLKELNNNLISYRNNKGIKEGYRTNYIFIAAKTYQFLGYGLEDMLKNAIQ